MKKLLAVLIAFYLFIPFVFSQDDEIRQPALGISFVLKDFATAALIRSTSLSEVFRNDKWTKLKNMSPGMAITYFKGLKKHIDFAGTLTGSFVNYPVANNTFSNNKFLLEADASLNFKLTSEKYWVQPHFIAGLGGQKYANYYGAFIPLGLGVKVNFFDETHLFMNAQYRVPVTTQTAAHHFQFSFGVAGALGKKKPVVVPPPPPPPPPPDTDGDGITDDKDKCPTVPGLARYDGCPIPDRDKDGINDEEDACPDVPGLARYKGCPIPDRDKDGINDEEDKCPDVFGVARYQGCPVPDTDGDGVNDEEDKCPKLFCTKANQGCPDIKPEIKEKVDYGARNTYFATAKYTLLSRSFKGLDEIVKVLKENPDMYLDIEGHTDNVGKDDYNQTLSDNRANSVKQYFISKGIDEKRLSAKGFGETTPVADNNTAAGRQKNRRVEMRLKYF